MILTRDGKEIIAIYKQNGDEVDEVKDADGRLVYTNTREITGTLPLSFTSRGKPLSDYRISGNTVQDGTPTPDAPVDVVGCGVRTENLYEKGDVVVNVGDVYKTIPISLSAGKYTFSFVYESENTNGVTIIFYNGSTAIQYSTATITDGEGTVIIDAEQPITTIRLYSANGYMSSQSYSAKFTEIMLNTGSAALPYEPYGYKLPITVNGTESPIYLGEAQTTRRVKKLVLTENEDWLQSVPGVNVYRINVPDYSREIGNIPICTHYKGIAPVAGTSELQDLETAFLLSASGNNYYYIRDDRFNNANDFKSYLAQQYQNGTPVTVWYVLADSETGIVNEPLMKIGDYADTITMAQAGVTIPTVSGTNVLDMATPVKPSEVYIKGKGIRAIT